jgi:hypothetical protein
MAVLDVIEIKVALGLAFGINDLEKCCTERIVVSNAFHQSSSSLPWIVEGVGDEKAAQLTKMSHARRGEQSLRI